MRIDIRNTLQENFSLEDINSILEVEYNKGRKITNIIMSIEQKERLYNLSKDLEKSSNTYETIRLVSL